MLKPFSKKEFINSSKHLQKNIIAASKKFYSKGTAFIKKRPLISFLFVLGLLLIVLITGQLFQKRTIDSVAKQQVKSVTIFSLGEAPKATFQAKIEKSGVVKIIAQTGGVVQKISVQEGTKVWKGQQLISLASNYQGGNAGSVQRQIAQKQYQNVLDTFEQQKDVIQKQKDSVNISAENAEKMREISRKSIDETNALINANQTQLDQMKQSLDTLITTNPNDPSIPTLQSGINQLQGGINQLRQAGRSVDYSSSNDNPPAKLENLQKDIAIKQLEVQEKGLELHKEVTRLQVSLAYINESLMYPASPFSGIVERVYVKQGQLVSPGTLLATVTATAVSATAILNVPEKIAKIIMQGEPSELLINDKKVAVVPYYVSSQATEGQLYSVFYDVPEGYQSDVADGEYVAIRVPVNPITVIPTDPFVPIDAVYQTQDQAFLLVEKNGKAQSKIVKLGNVYGSYVEVLSGVGSGDQIILDRNVIAGDRVKVE